AQRPNRSALQGLQREPAARRVPPVFVRRVSKQVLAIFGRQSGSIENVQRWHWRNGDSITSAMPFAWQTCYEAGGGSASASASDGASPSGAVAESGEAAGSASAVDSAFGVATGTFAAGGSPRRRR